LCILLFKMSEDMKPNTPVENQETVESAAVEKNTNELDALS